MAVRPSRLIALCVAVAATAAADPPPTSGGADADGARTLTVKVVRFRNRNGALECSLFAGPDGFPKGEKAAAQRRAPIGADLTATCVFSGLAPGEYAVGVMHDENANGKFDQGLFGVPLEGYGFTNNHTHALSAPTWEESRVRIGPGESPVLTVELRY